MPAKTARKITKPPILFHETQKIITAIEKKIAGTFLAYWNSPNGSVCQNDVVGFYELLREIGKQKKIALFVKSDGGNGTASLRIVHLLRQFAPHLTVMAPLVCASAATMIALGADEIQMGPLAHLSAVDTSLTHDLSPIDKDNDRVRVSPDELSRILKLWRSESHGEATNPYSQIFQYIHPLVIGAVDRASSLSMRLCMEILSYHLKDEKKSQAISHSLNSDYPSHGYPITSREARRIGLNATELDTDLNDLLIELNEIYSEMGQKAITDYDEQNYHDHGILNIIECKNIKLYYQNDTDWHYMMQERRWIRMNDNSSWRKMEMKVGKLTESVFHIR
jgi:hypothetical protein